MTFIAHIDPFVDWAVTLADARREIDELAGTYLPVFFEGNRTRINDMLEKHGVAVFLPDPTAIEDIRGRKEARPLLRESTSLFNPKNGDLVSGFYFMAREDLIQLAEHEELRAFVGGVGTPVRINDNQYPEQFEMRSDAKAVDQPPIVAVIDEGIGYLNSRFRKRGFGHSEPAFRTRFIALWQQTVRPVPQANSPYIELGRVLTSDEIDEDLARLDRETEFDIYRRRNAEIFGSRTHRSTEQAFSHGTAVLDLAAGASLNDAGRAADILAVQLPPETLEDTSGTHVQAFLMMGLDWLLALASKQNRSIIVNVSLGFSAGTKTGEALLERALRSRIEAFNAAVSGDSGNTAQLVFAYGNSYRDRLNARFDLDGDLSEAALEWNVQPDDPTPSFLQIHRVDATNADLSDDIELVLKSPSGQVFAILPGMDECADLRVPDADGVQRVVGRIFQDRLEGTARVTIALAPTQNPLEQGLVAESGRWSVSARRLCKRDLSIVFQVQRDDTAAGFARGGRQSYLDHPNGYLRDKVTGDYDMPDGGPGLSRKGTNSAMMVRAGNVIHLVGGIEPDPNGGVEGVRPTRESAASDDWSQRPAGPGPSYSAISEDGPGNPGVLASGTFSGTTVLVNGTSVAAAKITRDLSQIEPGLRPHPTAPATDRVGEVRIGSGGARRRHPEF